MVSLGYGITVADACNGSASTNQTLLISPADILFIPNVTLYVNSFDGKLLAFQLGKRTADVLAAFND
jgi:hypothetical protein